MSKLENKNKGEPIWGSYKGDPNSAQFIVGYHPSEIRDRDTNKTLDLHDKQQTLFQMLVALGTDLDQGYDGERVSSSSSHMVPSNTHRCNQTARPP